MSVTIREVAKRAGVSPTTVSRVRLRRPYVSEKTRIKVLAAADELGYDMRRVTDRPSTARTNIIGLAFPYASEYLFTDPNLMRFIRGVEQISVLHDNNILLAPANEQDDASSGLARLMRTQYIDGAIVAGMRAALEAGAHFHSITVPTISLGYQAVDQAYNIVHADNRRGALQATRHLISLGHQHIGVINATATLTDLDERMAGYQQALAEARIPFEPGRVSYGDFTESSGARAAAELFDSSTPPEAIFALNDRMAIGAIQQLRRLGYRVPEDVAVVGFDDIPAAAMFEPALTTVRQPAIEMGKTAARMLFGLIEGKIERYPEAILPALLIIRESCGGKRE